MGIANVGSNKFFIIGDERLDLPWDFLSGPSERINTHWTVAALPDYTFSPVGVVDMGLNTGTAAKPYLEDWLSLAADGRYFLDLNGVEYVDAVLASAPNVVLDSVGKEGFTTNGSLASITTNVGNHQMVFTTALRDSAIFVGAGYDKLTLADNPDVNHRQYWAVVRRDGGQIDAYNLYTGYRIRVEGGDIDQLSNVVGVRNYGELESLVTYSRGGGLEPYLPGRVLTNTGDRGTYAVIDLSAENYTVEQYTDTFNSASFASIRFTTQNLYVGQATIETFVNDNTKGRQSELLTLSTNGTKDLAVYQQATELDGHLRLYVRNADSGLYNRFNEVYLGTSGDDQDTNTGGTTSLNGPATGATGGGAAHIVHTAMYGFGGNDSLTAGAGDDYLFGGTSTYTTISPSGLQGNVITGGDGADHFGVGNVAAGSTAHSIQTSSFTLAGSAPSGAEPGAVVSRTLAGAELTAELATRVATDRIQDWTAGTDYLRVLANGTAIIEGLGTANGSGASGYTVDFIGGDSEKIDLGGANVVNDGKIVALGREGNDTLIGSAGDDYLYGNGDVNLIVLDEGGTDRVFYDTFDSAQSKHYVSTFSASNDFFYLNKRVIDAFGGNSSRSMSAVDVGGTYTAAVGYSPSVNYLHDVFYSPAIVSSTATHDAQDGTSPGALSGADGTTFTIGIGMIAAGYALLFVPFAQAAGYALIASGTVLGAGSTIVNTQEHRNAIYTGDVSNYLNVITANTSQTAGNTTVASSVSINDDNVTFLSFFGGSDAGDGFVPVVEFTANAGQGVYGYFALHSNTETFVFLVASRDNLVENGEAIKIAEISGILDQDDFKIYDGLLDIYNYSTISPVVLREPTVTQVRDGSGDQGMTDDLIDNISGSVLIDVEISGSMNANSFLRVYDGVTKIYDGALGNGVVNAAVTATFSVGTNTYTVTDARALGTVATKTDSNAISGNNDFVLRDSVVNYSVEFVDGTTGIPTRDSSGAITISGGNSTIDGGAGTDSLSVTGTSDFLNGAGNAQLVGIETIYINAADSDGDGDVDGFDSPVTVDLHLQGEGFTVFGSSISDVIKGSQGNDTIMGLGGQDSIDLSAGGDDQVSYSYTNSLLGNDTSYDTVIGITGGSDKIYVSPAGLADTDNDGQVDDAVPGWVDKDGNTNRLLYETATIGANSAVSSATELLVVSNASVSTSTDLTDNIAAALGSAFNLAGLDGTSPSAATGGGSDSTSLFAVLSDQAGKWWVGRYVDSGNDDSISGSEIEVFGLFQTDNILNSFWLGTTLAPQQLQLSMPADSGLTEAGTYTTNVTSFSVTGLQAGSSVYYSLNAGTSWSTGTANQTSISLGEGTHTIWVRQVDSAGNFSPLSEITTASRSVVVDTTNPAISNLSKSGSSVGYAAYSAGLGDINLSWSLSEANSYGTVVQYKLSTDSTWTNVAAASYLTGNQSISVNDLAAGTYNWRVSHTDKAGNSSSVNGSDFTLTPPDVDPPTYGTSDTFNNGMGYFSFDFQDVGSGILSISVATADVEVRFQGTNVWYGEYLDGYAIVGNSLRIYPRNMASGGPAYDTWSGSDHRVILDVTVTDNAGNVLHLQTQFQFDAGDVGYYSRTWTAGEITAYLNGTPPANIPYP